MFDKMSQNRKEWNALQMMQEFLSISGKIHRMILLEKLTKMVEQT